MLDAAAIQAPTAAANTRTRKGIRQRRHGDG
jgi:hypothetical protein